MEKEFYGNGDFNRNDSNASGKPFPTAFSGQEEQQIIKTQTPEYPEFNTANRRMENYFLNFSSKL